MIDRRHTIVGLGAFAIAGLSTGLPALAAPAARLFDLRRNGVRMGEQSIAVRLSKGNVIADIEVDIVARILTIPVWRYNFRAREIWRHGKLRKLTSRTNNNGQALFVDAEAAKGGIAIESSKFKGNVHGSPATSTYWTKGFMKRRVWINAEHGTPQNIRATRSGIVLYPSAYGPIKCERWSAPDILNLKVYYDKSGECVGSQFDGAGAQVSAVMTQKGGPVSSLWNQG